MHTFIAEISVIITQPSWSLTTGNRQATCHALKPNASSPKYVPRLIVKTAREERAAYHHTSGASKAWGSQSVSSMHCLTTPSKAEVMEKVFSGRAMRLSPAEMAYKCLRGPHLLHNSSHAVYLAPASTVEPSPDPIPTPNPAAF